MAISQAMVTSFKKALLDGEMDFSSNTSQSFKIALFTSSASLDATTTAYSTTNEVSGTNYTAGGNTLALTGTNASVPTTSGTTAFLSFASTTWGTATITARGALIYKSGGGDPAVAVLDFGADKTATAGDFTINFPISAAGSAIIRIA
jgi:hypothetical protein|tara:strand:+ start:751 stop:1194 length:444 start_codon:yes stop_codon:yes gene_type:complete